jgi:hypothetical protein
MPDEISGMGKTNGNASLICKKMVSGFCSRHPMKCYSYDSIGEDFVTFIVNSSVPMSINLQDLASATAQDA